MEIEQNIQKNKQSSVARFFSEAILVTILTAVGYLAAFSYQYTYLRYFGIPTYFVDINLSLVLLMAFSGLICLTILFTIIEILIRRNLDKKGRRLGLWILMCLVIYLPIIFCLYNPFYPIVSIFIIFILLIIIVITSIQIYRQDDQIRDTKKGLLDRIEFLYGVFPIALVMILLLFVGYCGIAGRLVAQYQENYLVADTSPPRIIISTFGDDLIGISFSTTTNMIGKDITLITPETVSKNEIDFTESKLGNLYPTNFSTFSGWFSGIYF